MGTRRGMEIQNSDKEVEEADNLLTFAISPLLSLAYRNKVFWTLQNP
jgi:hypothetical protein